MRSAILSLGLVAIIGVVIVLLLQSPDTTPVTPQFAAPVSDTPFAQAEITSLPESSTDEINALRQQLQQEITARKKLQNTVNELSKKITALATQQPSTDGTTNNPASINPRNRDWFNQQALIDAGVGKSTAQNLKIRFETQALEKLYLRDNAMREGWFGSRRYRNELELLDAQLSGLQEEIGDQAYEAYLFASGQPNQVMVQSVLASSSADTAGIRADDQILSYDGQRIFNWRALRTATTQGTADENVTIEIIRDGKRLQLYVPRGPLGVRMDSASVAP
jgi:membrane-associated protease RseP (regulator of RpoE activity)